MGSIEEERLFQMVHDFIESESSPPMFPASSKCPSFDHQANYSTLQGCCDCVVMQLSHRDSGVVQEILGAVTDAEARVLQSVLKHMRSKRDAGKTTNLRKWLVMKLELDGFNASIHHTSWVTSLGCPAGDYEYIDVIVNDRNGKKLRQIVDVDFRSQFELARPTPSYKELADTLPSVFVGSEDKLMKIISLVCSAAERSLRDRGLHVPPWRTSTYMQSKWLSGCSKGTAKGIGYSRENRKAKIVAHGFGMWETLVNKPNRRDLHSGSGLSNQFSDVGINCC